MSWLYGLSFQGMVHTISGLNPPPGDSTSKKFQRHALHLFLMPSTIVCGGRQASVASCFVGTIW
eukprot:scaffold2267_cov87-Skeletonema_menzelii.AAC.1